MAWTETESLSFTARHDTEDDGAAQRTLDALEDLRLRLEERFDDAPGGITVVIHPTPGWLAAAHPFLPAARLAAAPAGRRYLAGWAMASELHVLNDDYLERRAAGEDSMAALHGTAERLYAQIVVASNNGGLPPPWGPRKFWRYVRWAWLIEGGAQYFAGQTSLFRAAVNTRMRQGDRPAFPPSARDAIILGGTVFDLLERERGRDACAILVSRLRREGAERAIELAFDARFREVESEWHRYLRDDMPRAGSLDELVDEDPFDLDDLREQPDDRRGDRQRGDHPDQQPKRPLRVRLRDGGRRGLVRVERGEQLAGGLDAGLGDEDVARAAGEEVGNIEAAAAALDARDPLLEQDPLDQLRLGEVLGERGLDQLAAEVLGPAPCAPARGPR